MAAISRPGQAPLGFGGAVGGQGGFLWDLPRWPLLGLLAVAFAIYLRLGTVRRPLVEVDRRSPAARRPGDPLGFGQPVLAPADATVVRAHDAKRDHWSRTRPRPCSTWPSRGRSASCSAPAGSSATTWCSTWGVACTPP